jgi:hypothetical protein
MPDPRHYLLLTCNVLAREAYLCSARSKNLITVQLLDQELHDLGAEKMSARIQESIDRVDPARHEAVLLGYGLCNNGVVGLHAPVPLVISRAHDCITLLLGSRERYNALFSQNPGTIYESVGWIEAIQHRIDNPRGSLLRYDQKVYQEFVEKYGEDNADYLMEELGGLSHYSKLTYIDMPVGQSAEHRDTAAGLAAAHQWAFEEVPGNVTLMQRLVDGDWESRDFLVIQPGEKVEPSFDDGVVKAVLRK